LDRTNRPRITLEDNNLAVVKRGDVRPRLYHHIVKAWPTSGVSRQIPAMQTTVRGDKFAHGSPGSPNSREKAPPGDAERKVCDKPGKRQDFSVRVGRCEKWIVGRIVGHGNLL
jgi:hypothetical protein